MHTAIPSTCVLVMQSLAQILAAFSVQNGAYRAQVTADWQQGRTLFGGLSVALADQAMRSLLFEQRPLRAMQVVYVGPAAAGSVECRPSVLRAGKAVTLTSCTVHSDSALATTVTAMYGAARESSVRVEPSAAPCDVPPNAVPAMPFLPGISPAFTQHFDMRWARGRYPFTGAVDSRMSVYVRYRDEPGLSAAHALALMDAIPSPALALLTKPSPASTLSWTLELLDNTFDFAVDDWWRLDAVVDSVADGYAVHTSQVINPAGALAAISRQVATVYG
jgi:acyl-CoA thioesterase